MPSNTGPIYETTYTDPDIVAETMMLPDPHDPLSMYKFSNVSNPSYDAVMRLIRSNEEQIDFRTNRSWKVNCVIDEWVPFNVYRNDCGVCRPEYWQQGGEKIQLHKDILPWDPRPVWRVIYEDGLTIESIEYPYGTVMTMDQDTLEEALEEQSLTLEETVKKLYPGDRILIRRPAMSGGSVKQMPNSDEETHSMTVHGFELDRREGLIYIRTPMLVTYPNDLIISYRYGSEEAVPYAIQRLCSLMTAKQILAGQFWVIKYGGGGDISGLREQTIRQWDEEMASIWSSYQAPATVHSMITR